MTEATGPVLVLESDLFFVVKIREPLRPAGREVVVIKRAEDLAPYLAASPLPSCLVVHFGAAGIDWAAVIAAAQAAGVPVLAYGSHVDEAAQVAARAAGATRVIANSKLAGDVITQIDQTIARLPPRRPEVL